MKDDLEQHAMGFVGATVTLALFSGLALLLICLFAMRMRKKRGRSRSNTGPLTSNLENIRRNLQEFVKIRRMCMGSLPIPLQSTSSYHNPGFNPYFNSNGPSNYNVPPQGYNQAMVAPPAAPPVAPPPAAAPAANIVPPNNGR